MKEVLLLWSDHLSTLVLKTKKTGRSFRFLFLSRSNSFVRKQSLNCDHRKNIYIRTGNCAIFLCYTTIMLNSVTIHAIRKTSSSPKPLKTLLLNLAASDLCVGLLVQPVQITVLVMQLDRNAENSPTFKSTYLTYVAVVNLFYYTSFFSVTALSLDRFLAVRLHLRYQELVTHKRVVAVVISIWVFGALLSLIGVLLRAREDRYAVYVTVEMFCLITAALLYYNIYLAVRRHTRQIRSLQIQREVQNGEMANAARL